jgi:putative oxidoreductase
MKIIDWYTAQSPRILAITRFIFGASFSTHGAQKLFGLFGGMPPGVPAFITYGAGSIEFFGGILIALGLFTRSVAFLASGLMAFAYFIGHAPGGFWPNVNGGEVAVLFCFFFLFLSAHGPGAWAIDNAIRGARANARNRRG